MFYFTLTSRYTKNGYWGLTEDVRELITPKYLAAMRVLAKLRGDAPATAPANAPCAVTSRTKPRDCNPGAFFNRASPR